MHRKSTLSLLSSIVFTLGLQACQGPPQQESAERRSLQEVSQYPIASIQARFPVYIKPAAVEVIIANLVAPSESFPSELLPQIFYDQAAPATLEMKDPITSAWKVIGPTYSKSNAILLESGKPYRLMMDIRREGTYRLKAPVGMGCASGVSMFEETCEAFMYIVSDSFEVFDPSQNRLSSETLIINASNSKMAQMFMSMEVADFDIKQSPIVQVSSPNCSVDRIIRVAQIKPARNPKWTIIYAIEIGVWLKNGSCDVTVTNPYTNESHAATINVTP